MASPHVAAAAAILKSVMPQLSNVDIRQRLQQETALDLGQPGQDDEYGYGLIDIDGALDWSPPPPSFAVNIEGPGWPDPTTVRPFEQCLYKALVQDGTPPYTFS